MNIKNNCRKATYLVEKELFGSTSFIEKIQLKIHMTQCPACRLYWQQSGFINKLILNLLRESANNAIVLDEPFKTELKKAIIVRLETKNENNL